MSELTVTLFVMSISDSGVGAVTVIRIGGASPTDRLGRVQVTTPAASPQVQPSPAALSNVTSAGNVSTTSTASAVLGPALLTASVYVRSAPPSTGSGSSVLTTDRSAWRMTSVSSVAVLLSGFGSSSLPDTSAELVRIVPWAVAGSTVTTTSMVAVASTARLPRSQVIVPAASLQLP